MITRKNRFHGHHSVSRVRGFNLHGRYLSLRYATKSSGDYRAAVVVSKKVDKRAVVRNRIRRRLFEIIRVECGLSGKPIDVVVYVKTADVATLSPMELKQDLVVLTRKALDRSRLLNKD